MNKKFKLALRMFLGISFLLIFGIKLTMMMMMIWNEIKLRYWMVFFYFFIKAIIDPREKYYCMYKSDCTHVIECLLSCCHTVDISMIFLEKLTRKKKQVYISYINTNMTVINLLNLYINKFIIFFSNLKLNTKNWQLNIKSIAIDAHWKHSIIKKKEKQKLLTQKKNK